jgi:PKHD-type hydroxylase
MILSNYYWYFKSALTPKFCDDVIKYGLQQKDAMALTSSYGNKKLTKQDVLNLKKRRNSDLVWLNDTWIYKEIHPFVVEANQKAGWNFQWDSSQSCQFTKYKLNQYYDWHCDIENKIDNNGKVRKLSMTCQLTDGSEYQGGELEFDFRNYDPPQRDEPKGSIIIFPSFVWHRVKPVTKGVRYSLVVWNQGLSFK